MIEFDHPNILKLIGVCLDGGPVPYIIMPFMENGSLLSYLIKERESLLVQPDSSKSNSIVSYCNFTISYMILFLYDTYVACCF